MKKQHQIKQTAYHEATGFIYKYQELIRNVVIPYQYEVLNDNAPGVEKSGVIQNFINAGRILHNETPDAFSTDKNNDTFYGMVFQDSDVAKWIEAAAYSLANHPDKDLEKKVDQVIALIANAQDKDGYLNTYFTISHRKHRWQNLLEAHELYCAGHMIEAGCAYKESTGKDNLLCVIEKLVDHIYDVFIQKKHAGYPGHPEIELALMKMYHLTKNKKCLELATHFIDIRGVDKDFYVKEQEQRDWSVWDSNPTDYDYRQNEFPVRRQKDAVGHAVRAAYLYTGMADVASVTNDKELLTSCETLWNSITQRRMYITGGIGSTVIGEAFSTDYDLPNDTAYAETCAAIGLFFFASRMLENEVDSKYADIMERAFYNGILSGMGQDGKHFFYVNPLECIPGISGNAPTHSHALTQRPTWYACACCPPNLARTISSFGKYAYGENETTAYCHLFAGGSVHFENGMELLCTTNYPEEHTISYNVIKSNKELAIRIPAWSDTFSLYINDCKIDTNTLAKHSTCVESINTNTTDVQSSIVHDNKHTASTKLSLHYRNGYLYLNGLCDNDTIKLVLDFTPHFIYPSAKIPKLSGMAAAQAGPLVYCFEGIDNQNDILSLALNTTNAISWGTTQINAETVKTIEVDGIRFASSDELYQRCAPEQTSCKIVGIPYYLWGNRGENQMRIWMPLIR